MKLVLAKQDFRNSDAWSEVCDTLGLPDNTTQVEISASATKVRTVEHPAWEEKEFWQNLVAEHIMGVDLVDAVRNGEVDGLKIEPSEDEAGYVKMMMRRRLKDNEQWDSETVEDDPYELSSASFSSRIWNNSSYFNSSILALLISNIKYERFHKYCKGEMKK